MRRQAKAYSAENARHPRSCNYLYYKRDALSHRNTLLGTRHLLSAGPLARSLASTRRLAVLPGRVADEGYA